MSDFTPDCYGIKADGRPMPARFVGMDPAGLLNLAAPSGKVYTFAPDHVLPVEEVEAQIHTNKVAYVARNYRFEEISCSHGRREIRCFDPRHPIRSSYILTITRSRSSCTCPAFVKSAGVGCKHLEAFMANQPAAPAEAPVKKPAETFTAEEW